MKQKNRKCGIFALFFYFHLTTAKSNFISKIKQWYNPYDYFFFTETAYLYTEKGTLI